MSMLPSTTPPELTRALTVLSEPHGLSRARVRARLRDGTVLEGTLISGSAAHLSLLMESTEARYIPAHELLSLHLAAPRRLREWGLAAVGIGGTTTALVGLAAIPGLHLERYLQHAFIALFYLGAGALSVLLAKTRLREWLTRWDCMYDAGGP